VGGEERRGIIYGLFLRNRVSYLQGGRRKRRGEGILERGGGGGELFFSMIRTRFNVPGGKGKRGRGKGEGKDQS